MINLKLKDGVTIKIVKNKINSNKDAHKATRPAENGIGEAILLDIKTTGGHIKQISGDQMERRF